MLGLLLRRRYRRTCTVCGESWEVTRRQAKGAPERMRRPRRLGAGTRGGPSLDVAGSVARHRRGLEVWASYRRCPRCGLDAFTQAACSRPAPG